jgi:hypothetical protein
MTKPRKRRYPYQIVAGLELDLARAKAELAVARKKIKQAYNDGVEEGRRRYYFEHHKRGDDSD